MHAAAALEDAAYSRRAAVETINFAVGALPRRRGALFSRRGPFGRACGRRIIAVRFGAIFVGAEAAVIYREADVRGSKRRQVARLIPGIRK